MLTCDHTDTVIIVLQCTKVHASLNKIFIIFMAKAMDFPLQILYVLAVYIPAVDLGIQLPSYLHKLHSVRFVNTVQIMVIKIKVNLNNIMD